MKLSDLDNLRYATRINLHKIYAEMHSTSFITLRCDYGLVAPSWSCVQLVPLYPPPTRLSGTALGKEECNNDYHKKTWQSI